MDINLKGKSFLKLLDFSPEEIAYLLDLSAQVKKEKKSGQFPKRLQDKNIALIFEKSSTRTRCSFAVAASDEGAYPEYLGKGEVQLGKKESVKDTARVLGRLFDAIAFRGFRQEDVEALAEYSGIPVYNGLTDEFHPTQILADFMTIREHSGKLQGVTMVFAGDGRSNMANSLMIGSAMMGLDFRILTNTALFPDKSLVAGCEKMAAKSGAKITITDDRDLAVEGADYVYTDVWASMGEEDVIEERISLLKHCRVDMDMMRATGNENVKFLHCLPCFHDLETELARQYPEIMEATDEVFESPMSIVFDQAENRMHTIKAVMVATL